MKKVFGTGILVLVCGLFSCLFLFYYFGRDLPDYTFLRNYTPPTTTRLYSQEGSLVNQYSRERRTFIPINNMPEILKKTFLSAEDKNFYYHMGIDLTGIWRALVGNIFHKGWSDRATGASTITQQLAKNFLVGKEKSLKRKIREAIMAFRLEMSLSKERILELYLNEIYLGMGTYGVGAAALTYFNKSVEELSLHEIAYLASLPKAPANYHPFREQKKALMRRNWVLKRLKEDQIISTKEYEEAHEKSLSINPYPFNKIGDFFSEDVRRTLQKNYGRESLYHGGLNVYLSLDLEMQKACDEALREGLRIYDKRKGWRGPLKHINYNPEDQSWISELKQLEREIHRIHTPAMVTGGDKETLLVSTSKQKNIALSLKDHEWIFKSSVKENQRDFTSLFKPGDIILIDESPENPQQGIIRQIPLITGGIVVMDPETGEVRALSGGYAYGLSHFNCATQARRQTGSAFKPIVYAAALESGYTPKSIINDMPVSYKLGPGMGYYTPKNYSGKSYGPSPLKDGIIFSRNMMTVNLAQTMGVGRIKKLAQKLGAMDNMPLELSMSLGAGESTLMRMVAAYSSLLNGGFKVNPVLIKSIQNHKGENILVSPHPFAPQSRPMITWEKRSNAPSPQKMGSLEEIISSGNSKIISDMLKEVVEQGTAQRLKPLKDEAGLIIGGKTGTTNDFKDAWFIGFTESPANRKRYVIGVFVGYPIPKSLGIDENGSRVAIPLFEIFVRKAQERLKR